MSDMNWDAILDKQVEVDKEFGPVPADDYHVKVGSAEATTSGAGNAMIKLQLDIVAGPYAGKKVFTQIVFTDNPKAMRFTLQKLAALGVSKESLRAQNPSYDVLAKMLLHSECTVTVTVGEYNDAPSNNVEKLKPLAGATKPPAAPNLPGKGPKPGVPNIPVEKPAPEIVTEENVSEVPEEQVDPEEADTEAAPDDESEPF